MSGAGVVLGTKLDPYDSGALANLIDSSVPKSVIHERPAPSSALSDGKLDSVIGWFSTALYTEAGGTSEDRVRRQNALRDARNQVQGMLMTRSGNLCTSYKLYLRERATNVNFFLGTAATLLGSAGAVVTGTAAQALAAAAGAASGTKAEYEKDILSSVTTSVIIPGIDRQRTALQQEISNRRCLGVSSYTLTQALLDAVRFHAACSTDVGIAVAGSAVSQSRTTTLADAKATVDAVQALHASLNPSAMTKTDPAGTDPAPSDTGQNKVVLLGDAIDMLQCPSLREDGIVPLPPPTPIGARLRPMSEMAPANPAAGAQPAPAAAVAGVSKPAAAHLFGGQVRFDVR